MGHTSFPLMAALSRDTSTMDVSRRNTLEEAIRLLSDMEDHGDPTDPPSSLSDPDEDCFVHTSSDERYA